MRHRVAAEKTNLQVGSPKAQEYRLDAKPICLVLRVLIRNQFLAHACCRLRIFNDANLVAQHSVPPTERGKHIGAFAHAHAAYVAHVRAIFSLSRYFFSANLYGKSLVYRSAKLKEK